MKKIAILTGGGGQGHVSVARAFEAWLKVYGYDPYVFDVLPKLNDKLYKILNKSPRSYNSLFKLTDKPSLANIMVEASGIDLKIRLEKMGCDLNTFDMVISTHPFLHPECKTTKIGVVLDPIIHSSYCAKPYMDKYVLFWNYNFNKLAKNGIKPDKIVVAGPLARPEFYKNFAKAKEGNLILVIAGGGWVHKTSKYLNIIDRTFKGTGLSFVFLCGKDKKFQEKNSRIYKNNNLFKFLGWLEAQEVASWINKSQAILAFSVAQMSVETGLLAKPIFIADYIKGQEDGYKIVLQEKKVAKFLPGTPEEKMDLLKTFLMDANPIKNTSLLAWKDELAKTPENIREFLSNL